MKKSLQTLGIAGLIAGLMAAGMSDVSAAMVVRELQYQCKGTQKVEGNDESANEEVLLIEDFSACTDALADSVSLNNSSTAMLDPEILGEEGWWGEGVYSSNGAVALAIPNWGGMINTPCMNLYGKITVSFRYRVLPGNKVMRNFWVNIIYGNPKAVNPVATFEESCIKVDYMPAESEKGWQDFSFTCDNPYNGDNAFVQINAEFLPPAGIEIDDLKITRTKDFVTPPISLNIAEITNNGFMTTWNPGAENKSYLVNCLAQKVLSKEPVDYTQYFTSDSLPENWRGEGCTVEQGLGFDGQNAVGLSLDQILYAPVNYSIVKKLKFSIKPYGITDKRGMSVVQILGLREDGVWEAPSEIMLFMVPTDGMVIDASEQAPKFLDKYIGFGFKFMNYIGKEDGKVYISDVNWSTDGSQERKFILNKEIVTDPFITVEGIDPDAQHFIQVAGVNGELVSSYTSLVEVVGVAAPENLEVTDFSEENSSYTVKWDNVDNADNGYIIRNYGITETDDSISGRIVMEDSFQSKLEEEIYIKDKDLDEYTDMAGWPVESKPGYETYGYAKVGGGQLGADGGSVLISPEICLPNNNGTFTLEFTLGGIGDVSLEVSANNEIQSISLPWGYDWETNKEVYGEKKCRLTFHSGEMATRIRFTSPNWHAFSLRDLCVKQDVNKGEYIYSLKNIIEATPGSTSADIDNKAFGGNIFACGVQSVMSNGEGAPYTSRVAMSPMVDFVSSSAGTANIAGVSVGKSGKCIWIGLPQKTEIIVYSVDGTQVCHTWGHEGMNIMETLPSGIYVVRCLDKSFKIIL